MAKRKSKKVEGAANITDGCNPELVDGARFDGILGIPVIERPEKLMRMRMVQAMRPTRRPLASRLPVQTLTTP